MPVLRRHTAEVGQGGIPQSRRATAAAFGGQSAAALQGLAQQGQRVSNQLVEQAERRDMIAAQRDAALAREKAMEKLDEMRQSGEPVTEDFSQFLDDEIESLREERSTEKGLGWADRTAANLRTDLMAAARARDAELVGEEAKNAANEIQRANGVFLQENPELLPELVAEQHEFIDGLDVPKQVKEALRQDMDASIARSAMQGWVRLDPELAKEKIRDGAFDAHTTPNDRQAMLSRADTRIDAARREERIAKAERENQRQATRSRTMIDALVTLQAEDPEERLGVDEIIGLSEQAFEDGEPVLTPTQVSKLFTLAESTAENGPTRTDPRVTVDIVPRLDQVTEDELIEHFSNGDLSQSDFEKWMGIVQEGDTPLKQVRSTSLKHADSFMGLWPGAARFFPQYGRFQARLVAQTQDREEQYRESGKNAVEYYRDGTFREDVQQLGQELGVLDTQQIIRQNALSIAENRGMQAQGGERVGSMIEDPRTGQPRVYVGGDPSNADNWVPVEEVSP